jgi:hydrogenase maturation protease
VIRRGFDRLAEKSAHVVDYGIRGVHLAHDLLDEWDALILIDAIPGRGSPGTLHVFEAVHEALATTPALDAHGMDPVAVFGSLAALGGKPPFTVVVGCEVDNVDEGMGLSPPVDGAVAGAVDAVDELLSKLSAGVATTQIPPVPQLQKESG